MSSNNSPQLSPKKLLSLLYQPSLLLLGAGSILAFIALRTSPSDPQNDWEIMIYVCWGILFSFILLWNILRWYLAPTDFAQNKEVIDIFVKITGGILFVFTIYFTWQNFRLTQLTSVKNLEVAQMTLENNQKQQRNSSFLAALEKLGSTDSYQRVSALSAFERMDAELKTEADYVDLQERAKSNEERASLKTSLERTRSEHMEIMGVLINFIQENAAWKESKKVEKKSDIQTIIRILAQRTRTYENGEGQRLILKNTDLRGYKFSYLDAPNNFEGFLFQDAHLEGANFSGAKPNSGAKLNGANFKGAFLQDADLKNTDLSLADFDNTHLEGADMTGATAKEFQFVSAILDQRTKCPSGLKLSQEGEQSWKCVKKAP